MDLENSRGFDRTIRNGGRDADVIISFPFILSNPTETPPSGFSMSIYRLAPRRPIQRRNASSDVAVMDMGFRPLSVNGCEEVETPIASQKATSTEEDEDADVVRREHERSAPVLPCSVTPPSLPREGPPRLKKRPWPTEEVQTMLGNQEARNKKKLLEFRDALQEALNKAASASSGSRNDNNSDLSSSRFHISSDLIPKQVLMPDIF